MESKVAIQSLVFIALFSYFTCKIIAAKNKLDAQKVGELRSEKTEDTVQGHTNCYWNDLTWAETWPSIWKYLYIIITNMKKKISSNITFILKYPAVTACTYIPTEDQITNVSGIFANGPKNVLEHIHFYKNVNG